MAKLINLRIYEYHGGKNELRISWDNGRHQAIVLHSHDAEGLKEAFIQAAHLLAKEIAMGKV